MTELLPPPRPHCRFVGKPAALIEARLRHGFPPSSHTVQIDRKTGDLVGGDAAHNSPVFHHLLAAARDFRAKNLTE